MIIWSDLINITKYSIFPYPIKTTTIPEEKLLLILYLLVVIYFLFNVRIFIYEKFVQWIFIDYYETLYIKKIFD
jgi:hypothetical protein